MVNDSNFTYANRITDGDPLELVPVVHPRYGTLAVYVDDMFDDTAAAIDVDIGLHCRECWRLSACNPLSTTFSKLH